MTYDYNVLRNSLRRDRSEVSLRGHSWDVADVVAVVQTWLHEEPRAPLTRRKEHRMTGPRNNTGPGRKEPVIRAICQNCRAIFSVYRLIEVRRLCLSCEAAHRR